MKKNIAISMIVAVAIIGFFGGYAYGKTKTPAPLAARRGGMAGGNFAFAGMAGGRMGAAGGIASGTVIAKDDKSITIAVQGNNGSKIVFTSATTEVSKNISGSLEDIAAGNTVLVTGTPNADGSISAQSIQIRPAMPANQTHATATQ